MTREEWLKERNKGIGGSDAAAVLNISPWKTSLQLWQEKRGIRQAEDIGDKPYIRYGLKAEEHMRALFALDYPQYRMSFEPYKIIRHPTNNFLFCTPDGEIEEIETGRRGGWEGKTATIQRTGQMGEWKDRIPDYYFAQVCHQMNAAGWYFNVVDARLIIPNAHKVITNRYFIERADVQGDIDYLVRQEIEFWDKVQRGEEPPLKIRL